MARAAVVIDEWRKARRCIGYALKRQRLFEKEIQMRVCSAVFIFSLLLSGTALAKDDHHECEAALDKLKSASEESFVKEGHHEHQQALEAHKSGDFKKCADQARKAQSHLKNA